MIGFPLLDHSLKFMGPCLTFHIFDEIATAQPASKIKREHIIYFKHKIFPEKSGNINSIEIMSSYNLCLMKGLAGRLHGEIVPNTNIFSTNTQKLKHIQIF